MGCAERRRRVAPGQVVGTIVRPVVPTPVQRLGDDAELNDEVIAQIMRLGLAALFLPQPTRSLVRVNYSNYPR
jgi:hypothetical protein